jgi:hypothetical protein
MSDEQHLGTVIEDEDQEELSAISSVRKTDSKLSNTKSGANKERDGK